MKLWQHEKTLASRIDEVNHESYLLRRMRIQVESETSRLVSINPLKRALTLKSGGAHYEVGVFRRSAMGRALDWFAIPAIMWALASLEGGAIYILAAATSVFYVVCLPVFHRFSYEPTDDEILNTLRLGKTDAPKVSTIQFWFIVSLLLCLIVGIPIVSVLMQEGANTGREFIPLALAVTYIAGVAVGVPGLLAFLAIRYMMKRLRR